MLYYVGEGNGNPLHYSCLENSVDRGAWWAAIYGVTHSRTRLKGLNMHACIGEGNGTLLQCSCLESPRDGGAWWAAVYGVAQSRTRLKRLGRSSSSRVYICQHCSLSSSHHLLPLLCPPVGFVSLCLYSRPTNRFINTIFSKFHISAIICDICYSLSDLFHSG